MVPILSAVDACRLSLCDASAPDKELNCVLGKESVKMYKIGDTVFNKNSV